MFGWISFQSWIAWSKFVLSHLFMLNWVHTLRVFIVVQIRSAFSWRMRFYWPDAGVTWVAAKNASMMNSAIKFEIKIARNLWRKETKFERRGEKSPEHSWAGLDWKSTTCSSIVIRTNGAEEEMALVPYSRRWRVYQNFLCHFASPQKVNSIFHSKKTLSSL